MGDVFLGGKGCVGRGKGRSESTVNSPDSPGYNEGPHRGLGVSKPRVSIKYEYKIMSVLKIKPTRQGFLCVFSRERALYIYHQ